MYVSFNDSEDIQGPRQASGSLRRTSVISEVAVSRDWGRIEGWPVTAD